LRKLFERFRRTPIGPDGLPIPPPDLRLLVCGFDTTPEEFMRFSEGLGAGVTSLLRWRHLNIGDFRAVLDFGCGCGRAIRNFHSVPGTRFYGTDYNPSLVEWCRENLPFAEFGVNHVEPPLSYDDGMFGFIYAFSVFTHFPMELQLPWMRELWRVLQPGGYLHLTVHGDEYAKALLSGKDREQFDRGECVALIEGQPGGNRCSAFHPQPYVRSVLTAPGFEVLEFHYGEPRDGYIAQDMYLFRKIG
jgi:SAM-dependent methyltransferase